MFGAYDQFLAIINVNKNRKQLDRLAQDDVAADPVYQELRGLGHEFQGALNTVFFDPEAFPHLRPE